MGVKFYSQEQIIKLSPYDLKQILFIDRKLADFENGRIDLFDLFNDLRGLLYMIESIRNDWKNEVETQVNNLELIYDHIMDEDLDVATCVKKIACLTKSILDDYLKVPDLSIAEQAIAEGPDWLICPKCHEASQSDSLFVPVHGVGLG